MHILFVFVMCKFIKTTDHSQIIPGSPDGLGYEPAGGLVLLEPFVLLYLLQVGSVGWVFVQNFSQQTHELRREMHRELALAM